MQNYYKVSIPGRLFFKDYYFYKKTNALKAIGTLRRFARKHKMKFEIALDAKIEGYRHIYQAGEI